MNSRDTRVLAEQLRIIYSQTIVALWATPIAGALLAWVFWTVVDHGVLAGWYVTLVGVTAARVMPWALFRRDGDAIERRPTFWGYLYALMCFLQGSCWGAAWVLFIPTDDPLFVVVVGMWVIGVSAASVSAYPAYLPVMLSFFLPVVLPGAVHMFVIGGTLGVAVGSGIVLYAAVVIRSMLPVNRLTIDAIRLNFELQKEIEERKRVEERLREISLTDALTQLANRRHFDEVLEREFRRAQRGHYPLSLVLIDIDEFKEYNDTYGHPEGDVCLQRLSRLIEEAVNRPGDLVARYGGEEIAIILPHTEHASAFAMAESIRERVQALGISHTGSKRRDIQVVTISAGVASMQPSDGTRATALVRAADSALYRAKEAGRNRVESGA